MGGGILCFTFAVICLTHVFSHLAAVAGAESCSQSAKMDLQIIVDSSGSIHPKQFRSMMKQISQSLIGQLDIGSDKTRVALFKYSRPNHMRNEFSLNKFTDLNELQAQVEATTREPGNTMTAMAMRKALEFYKEEQRDSTDTARVCLLFTDDKANDKLEVPAASKAWADDGVTVFAIGIGAGIDQQGLTDIAGAKERALQIENFDAIAPLATSLMQKVCTVDTPQKKNQRTLLGDPKFYQVAESPAALQPAEEEIEPPSDKSTEPTDPEEETAPEEPIEEDQDFRLFRILKNLGKIWFRLMLG